MAIAYDNKASATGQNCSAISPYPLSFSYTTGSGSDRALFVMVFFSATTTVTGVTYNGDAMTLVKTTASGNNKNYIYGLANPDSGANTLTINFSGYTLNLNYAVVSFTGVDQTNITGATEGTSVNNMTGISHTLTTSYDNSYVIDAITKVNEFSGNDLAFASSQTTIMAPPSRSGIESGSGYISAGAAGNKTVAYSWTDMINKVATLSSAEVRAAGTTTSTTTTTSTSTTTTSSSTSSTTTSTTQSVTTSTSSTSTSSTSTSSTTTSISTSSSTTTTSVSTSSSTTTTSTSTTTTSTSSSTTTTTLPPGEFALEVLIEMLDSGLRSVSTGDSTQAQSLTNFDTNDYDGNIAYYFEIIANNEDSSARSVYLIDSSGATVTSISVPAGTTGQLRLRTTDFAINSGADTYRVKVEQTTSNSQLKVYTARIVVNQTNATKTRIQVPLTAATYSDSSSTSITYNGTTTYGYGSYADLINIWLRTDSNFATVSGYALETVMKAGGSSETAYTALHNFTDDTIVAASETSVTGTTIAIDSTDFVGGDTNFSDGDEFDVQVKSSSNGPSATLYKASLYIEISPLTKTEVYRRIMRSDSGVVQNMTDLVYQRVYYNTSVFQALQTWYYEGTAKETSAGDIVMQAYDDTTEDSGNVPGGSGVGDIAFTADRGRARAATGALTTTSRYVTTTAGTGGALTIAGAWLMGVIQGSATSTSTTTTSTSTTTTTSTSSSTTTTSTSSTTTSISTSSSTTTTSTSSSSSTTTTSTSSSTTTTSTSSSTSTTTTSTSSSTSTTTTSTSSSTSTTTTSTSSSSSTTTTSTSSSTSSTTTSTSSSTTTTSTSSSTSSTTTSISTSSSTTTTSTSSSTTTTSTSSSSSTTTTSTSSSTSSTTTSTSSSTSSTTTSISTSSSTTTTSTSSSTSSTTTSISTSTTTTSISTSSSTTTTSISTSSSTTTTSTSSSTSSTTTSTTLSVTTSTSSSSTTTSISTSSSSSTTTTSTSSSTSTTTTSTSSSTSSSTTTTSISTSSSTTTTSTSSSSSTTTTSTSSSSSTSSTTTSISTSTSQTTTSTSSSSSTSSSTTTTPDPRIKPILGIEIPKPLLQIKQPLMSLQTLQDKRSFKVTTVTTTITARKQTMRLRVKDYGQGS